MFDPSDLDLLAKVRAAIDALPPKQREILLARRVENMSYDEIAALTGLSHRQIQRQVLLAVCNLHRHVCGHRIRWWHRFVC